MISRIATRKTLVLCWLQNGTEARDVPTDQGRWSAGERPWGSQLGCTECKFSEHRVSVECGAMGCRHAAQMKSICWFTRTIRTLPQESCLVVPREQRPPDWWDGQGSLTIPKELQASEVNYRGKNLPGDFFFFNVSLSPSNRPHPSHVSL